MFDTGTLDGLVRGHWFLPSVVFFHLFVAQVYVGLRKQFMNNFLFPTWGCAADFNNNKILINIIRMNGIQRYHWKNSNKI